MIRRSPRSTRTDPHFPSTTLFRSSANGGSESRPSLQFPCFRCSPTLSRLRAGSRKTTIFGSPSSECRYSLGNGKFPRRRLADGEREFISRFEPKLAWYDIHRSASGVGRNCPGAALIRAYAARHSWQPLAEAAPTARKNAMLYFLKSDL